MSNKKRKISPSTNDLDGPASKKRKLSSTEKTTESLIMKTRNICEAYSYKTRYVQTFLHSLSQLSVKERQSIIEKARNCNSTCNHHYPSNCNYSRIQRLLKMGLSPSASAYTFLLDLILSCSDQSSISVSKKNKIKIDIMKNFSNPAKRGEKYRPYMLTVQIKEKRQHFHSRQRLISSYSHHRRWGRHHVWSKQEGSLCSFKCYEGAIKTLENFTADAFLYTVKDFNFFRFQKKKRLPDFKYEYTECGADEVSKLLNTMKNDSQSQTFLLLMFFMTAYFKNFIFGAIKSAVQNSSISDISDVNTELNDDVLSMIMSFMVNYHSSLNEVFEDKLLVKQLMKEIDNAEEGWQDIFVDIVENDDEYTDLYEPQMKTYYDSEKLNLLNMRMYGKTLSIEKMKKWLKYCVEYDHYEIYEVILNQHCELKITVFKHIFHKIAFASINDKNEKWLIFIENKMNELKKILNKNQRKRFTKFCDDWKHGTLI